MSDQDLFQILNLFPFLIEEDQIEKLLEEIDEDDENSIQVQEVNMSMDD